MEPHEAVRPEIAAKRDVTFRTFFEANHDHLYRALWLATRNRHEAEELSQDAFLKVWERWDRVQGLENRQGYLYRTAMNALRSRVRRTKVALRRAVGQLPPDDQLAAVEEREAVIRVLAPLTPRQRAAVVLTDLLGFTSEEAGSALRIEATTVRVLASRARARLRETMGTDHTTNEDG